MGLDKFVSFLKQVGSGGMNFRDPIFESDQIQIEQKSAVQFTFMVKTQFPKQ